MTSQPLYEFDEGLRERLVALTLESRCKARVISRSQGTFGDVFRLEAIGGASPRYLAAKCPKISRFGSPEKAAGALENTLHEVGMTYRLLASPWVSRFIDIQLVYGWPFLVSRWHDGTLSDLIANPLTWTVADRLASLLLILRALRTAAAKGIGAHQDLKPENVFFVDIHRKFRGASSSPGLHFQILLGDFGNADAFRKFGRNTGSRPYMAPEQFETEPLEASAGWGIDVFAIGVIAHECLCDGLHPIGVHTSDVWPRKKGVPRKWGEARPWRKWAASAEKDLSLLRKRCPEALFSLLSAALSSDPTQRPSPETLEKGLWDALYAVDNRAGESIRFQVQELEAMYADDDWPYFDERLAALRHFYVQRS